MAKPTKSLGQRIMGFFKKDPAPPPVVTNNERPAINISNLRPSY
jgi:hypothetical protein